MKNGLSLAAALLLASCAAPAPVQLSEYPAAPTEDRLGRLWFPTAFDGVVCLVDGVCTNYTTADGLPSDTVRDVFEDDDGVLWFATGGGLVRYDGRTFAAWGEYAGASGRGGPGGRTAHLDQWDVHRDRRGRLWLMTLDGAFCHDGERFVRFEIDAQRAEHAFEFTPHMVYSVFEDDDGALWFATDGAGAVRWDGAEQVALTAADGLASDRVCKIVRDGRGDLWFGTSDGGVSRYDGSSWQTLLRNPVRSEHNGWGRFLGIVVDRQGDVWFGRSSPGGGAWRFDGAGWTRYGVDDGMPDGGVIDVSVDRAGGVWFGTTAGVCRFDGRGFVRVTR